MRISILSGSLCSNCDSLLLSCRMVYKLLHSCPLHASKTPLYIQAGLGSSSIDSARSSS